MSAQNITEQIRSILREHAELGVDVTGLDEVTDLYGAGMTSRATVSVMLALESEFDIEFPDEMLRRDVFESVAAIRDAVFEIAGA